MNDQKKVTLVVDDVPMVQRVDAWVAKDSWGDEHMYKTEKEALARVVETELYRIYSFQTHEGGSLGKLLLDENIDRVIKLLQNYRDRTR